MRKPLIKLLPLSILIITAGWIPAFGQSYIIGIDDLLSVTFWQDPTLNVTIKVVEDGTILLPVGGSVVAAGLTTEQLAVKIVESISLYDRRITSAVVTVTEYGSRKIYVMGQVSEPGKYMFEIIPNLWQIISEAGGPTENANLSSVMIIRDNKRGEAESQSIDLATILRNRDFDQLPVILPGDNIYVPAVVGNVTSSGINAVQAQQNVLFIYGNVGAPGVYTFNKELNLLEALVTAGGPSDLAKLKEVKVIRKLGAYSSVTEVDVDRYTRESMPQFFMVQGGDVIFVPRKKVLRETIFWEFTQIAIAGVISGLILNYVAQR